MYEYRTTILRHLDADTSWVNVDLGFDTHIKISVRWAGINAPEMSTSEGVSARKALVDRLPEGSTCTLRTIKDKKEKFGRYLGIFIDAGGNNLNDWLIEQGHAAHYGKEAHANNLET